MRKLLSAALLTATAVGSMLILPAGPAMAQSAACSEAVNAINTAFDAAPDRLIDDNGAKALATRLLSINAAGADKDAISAFARDLVDDNVTDLTRTFDAFNAVCAG